MTADARAATIEHLRRRMAEIPARSVGPTRPSLAALSRPQTVAAEDETAAPARPATSLRTLPVPGAVADLLPHRGLVRGSTLHVAGAASLRAGLLAAVTEAGGWAAIVGAPKLGLLAAAEMGAVLHRCAVVQDPGSDPIAVAAVLVEGLDFVLLSLGGVDVPPSRARAVTARVRRSGAVLAVVDGRWPTTDLQLDARVARYHGLDAGYGRVTGIDLDIQAVTRGQRPRRGTVTLAGGGGCVEWRRNGAVAAAEPLRFAR